MTVRTRFAPSPTGTPDSVHLGFVIRALWNYAFAKKNNGQFVLRIEDTDRKRSRSDTEENIKIILQGFRIFWDEGPDIGGPFGPYRQSERLEKYKKAADTLVEKGYAYFDFDAKVREKEEIKDAYESEGTATQEKLRSPARDIDPKEAKKRAQGGEPYVVRAKIPESKTFEYEDTILKKKIKFFGKFVPDAILLKSDGFPTYHLAVVVDDYDMKISHVFRGQEWISSTPIHLHVYEGLGITPPKIGHFTVVLDPRTKKKFSKRDLTSMFGVEPWIKKGYLQEAILNYLMLLGWAPKDNREMFTLEEFVQAFDLEGAQKANPIFNAQKLDWFNQQYIRCLDDIDLARRIVEGEFTKHNEEKVIQLLPLVKERMITLKDFDELTKYFFEIPIIDPELFKTIKMDAGKILDLTINSLERTWDGKVLETEVRKYCAEKNIKVGDFFMVLRIAITGKTQTPPLWETMEVLGKEESLARLEGVRNIV